MRLISIETTPNPNSMKLNFDESLGTAVTYSQEQLENCPEHVNKLLNINGVKTVFVCQDFMTLNKDPRADWRPILDSAAYALTGGTPRSDTGIERQRQAAEKLGQVSVLVQTFRGIPIQVKAVDTQAEKRIALDTRLSDAAALVQDRSGADYLKERYWADWGVRYGAADEIAAEVADEINARCDQHHIDQLIAEALGQTTDTVARRSIGEIKAELASTNWHSRLQAVQELGNSPDNVAMLIGALKDENHQVRRLAAAALGASGSETAIDALADVLLNDPSVGVRRTAGDAISDIGSLSAQPAICRALGDPNKLIRWRAARFLFDIGTEDALPFLTAAANDPEFEVRLEIEAAIERISAGKEGSMPAWKRILKNSE
ncbi:MAG TPA: virulence factor [Candidatus Obscuribacterales bacterium]